MQINILHLIEGAKQAKGLTVIIDVFRAFSLACYVMANGADRILPVGTIETAQALQKAYPTFLSIGERKGKQLAGFDYGNSPTQIEHIDFSEKTVIHTTSAGTQGIVNAQQATEILTGSFVNAQAIVNYIKTTQPALVSLVAMGKAGIERTAEDDLCAIYLKNALQGVDNDFDQIVQQLKIGSGQRFFVSESQSWAPSRDFDLCLTENKFDFILKVFPYQKEKEVLCLKKIMVPTPSI